jgi:hypothetical protein
MYLRMGSVGKAPALYRRVRRHRALPLRQTDDGDSILPFIDMLSFADGPARVRHPQRGERGCNAIQEYGWTEPCKGHAKKYLYPGEVGSIGR